ncbi:MAG: RDD family protein [Pseudonocardiaceae bacterium]
MQQRGDRPSSGLPDIDMSLERPALLADFGTRTISFLIDYVIPLIVVNFLLSIGIATGSVALQTVLTVGGYLGLLVFGLWNSCYRQGSTGQSIGRRVAKTKLVDIENGEPIGVRRALVRQFCHSLEFLIGLLWPLWDGKRQTFADNIVGTVVIRIGSTAEDHSGNSSS